jgi:hypothetical protein
VTGPVSLKGRRAAARDSPPLLRGRALQALGILYSQRGDDRAEATFREALTMFRAAGDKARAAVALNSLRALARDRLETASARVAFEEAIDVYRSLDDRHRLADSLSNLAIVALDQERLDEAALFAESIALDRAFDNHWGVAHNLGGQAALALARGAPDTAAALVAEAVEMTRPLGDRLMLVAALEGLAATAPAQNDHAGAARLWGAATAQREAADGPRTPADAVALDRYLDASRASLGPERFAAAITAGAALDLETALAEALGA